MERWKCLLPCRQGLADSPLAACAVLVAGLLCSGCGSSEIEKGQAAPEPQFESIFDGRTLDGWEGDPTYWRVEDGNLVGEITPGTLLERNSFLLWRGGEVADFELKLEYRISPEGNSGIGYRCQEVPGEPFAVRGYQADIEGGDNWSGIHYEERGRTFLALRGQKTIVEPGQRPRLVELFAPHEELQSVVRKEDWNEYHVIARGRRFTHILNGQVMNVVVDQDDELGARQGLLGVQVHVGPPMKVEFRNILLKRLPTEPVEPVEPPEPEVKALEFTNPIALAGLQEQAERLMTPPAKAAADLQGRLTLESYLHLVRSDLIEGEAPTLDASSDARDLVLIEDGREVRIPNAPQRLRELDWDKRYTFRLVWDNIEKAYDVTEAFFGETKVYP